MVHCHGPARDGGSRLDSGAAPIGDAGFFYGCLDDFYRMKASVRTELAYTPVAVG